MNETESATNPGEQPETNETDTNVDVPEEEAHLDDVADGAGCCEIWEHLSGHRDE